MSAAGLVSGHHFNPTRDYNHADDTEYKRLRSLANQEYERKKHLAEQSQAAYKQGDGGEAKRLSDQAKSHEAKMDQYNKQAVDFVFRANNADSAGDEIDLHGLYVKEAEEALETRINACLQRHETHLDVIVGKGLHSKGGVQKLKPAVERLCQKHGFRYATEHDNAGVIVIDFTGSGGNVPWHEIGPRPPRPSRPHQGGGYPQPGGYPQQGYNQPQYPGQAGNQYGYQQQQHQQQQQQQEGQSDWLGTLCNVIKTCLA